jgi:KDO2-lipid IV(A) lauroyltransferase
MSNLLFYLALPIILFISILPLRLLYIISDLMYPVVWYLLRYRKRIVLKNLRNSFPEKSEDEIRVIARKFYRHLTDISFEILKMRTISTESLMKRIRFSNPEVLQQYYDQGKGIVLMTIHYGNWEWTSVCGQYASHHTVVIYKPLNNRYFDQFMKRARERHGIELIPMRETLRRVIRDNREGNLAIYALISDQSPVWEEVQYWTTFLNQLTPVYTGAEKLAVRTKLPVVFYSMRKIRRGEYVIDFVPLCDNPSDTKEHEITERFISITEKKIRETPEYWLWTHRRWKLTPKKLAEK